MLSNNPEFRKNLKLEFSLPRFAIPLLLMLLCAWIGWNSVEPKTWKTLPFEYYQAEALFGWMCGFGFIFSIVWGTYLASNSLFGEIKQKTWDFVRMSSLSPAKILFGKLFGAPSVIWVITLGGILPLMAYALAIKIPGDGPIKPETDIILALSLTLICWLILSYATAFLIGLYTDNKESRHTAIGSTILILIIGLWIGGATIGTFNDETDLRKIYGTPEINIKTGTIKGIPSNAVMVEQGKSYMVEQRPETWYGAKITPIYVLAMSMTFIAFWSVIGAWRTLRASLQYKDLPIVWIAFLLTTAAYLHGWTISHYDAPFNKGIAAAMFWPAVIGFVTMILTCASEAGDIIRYRLFAEKLSKKKFKEAFRIMPLWIISFIIFLGSLLIASTAFNGKATLFFTSMLILMTRDVIAFHVIAWTRSIRRPRLGLLVYLAIVYGFAPAIASIVGSKYSKNYFFPLLKGEVNIEALNLFLYFIIHAFLVALLLLPFMKAWKSAFGENAKA